MPLIDRTDDRPVHFIGVAGAGMSALAELLVRRGMKVTGCDQNPAGVADLEQAGVKVEAGHDPAHLTGVRAAVYTSAMPKDHPELERARSLKVPLVRRAEALAECCAGGTLIGIAGTHGKSTTTVMTTEALAAAGISPTGVVGARVTAWGGNLKYGGDAAFVVEADEYDRSFLALWPQVAVVTNVEADHLDIYADLDDIMRTFAEFVGRARWVVLCADDPGSNALPSPATAEVIRYGITSPDARLRALNVRAADGGSAFDVEFDGKPVGSVTLALPGEHNVRNALAALAVGIGTYGLKVEQMAPGLAALAGAERRFQRLGAVRGIEVIDDYAHHPTEIAATLAAARSAFEGRRVVVCFQPHLFSRTRDFAAEFGTVLAQGDALFLCDIYPAREKPIDGVTSQLIADAAARVGRAPTWMGPRTSAAAALERFVQAGDVVLTVGAGDITKTGPELFYLLV
ncbi:MAG: UDP-N-acetylmuramate--L-alanine ligase [Gemmatimonadetes bacterium]|nr:UDP-N-acetylmuramate--L-alanine ligase [Gemmatimonadota bacterium]